MNRESSNSSVNSTRGLIVKRINYGEHDKILTFITSDHGRITAIAKGLKKPKSKLAGSLQALCEIQLSLLPPKQGDMWLVRGARINKFYESLVNDLSLNKRAYEILEIGYKLFPEGEESTELYEVFSTVLSSYHQGVDRSIVEVWFMLSVLKQLGQQPDLVSDSNGVALNAELRYRLRPEEGVLQMVEEGDIGSDEIKFWRLVNRITPEGLAMVKGANQAAEGGLSELRLFFDYCLSLNS